MNYALPLIVVVVLLCGGLAFYFHMRRRRFEAQYGQERIRRIAEYKAWQWLFGRSKHRRLTYQPVQEDTPPGA